MILLVEGEGLNVLECPAYPLSQTAHRSPHTPGLTDARASGVMVSSARDKILVFLLLNSHSFLSLLTPGLELPKVLLSCVYVCVCPCVSVTVCVSPCVCDRVCVSGDCVRVCDPMCECYCVCEHVCVSVCVQCFTPCIFFQFFRNSSMFLVCQWHLCLFLWIHSIFLPCLKYILWHFLRFFWEQ